MDTAKESRVSVWRADCTEADIVVAFMLAALLLAPFQGTDATFMQPPGQPLGQTCLDSMYAHHNDTPTINHPNFLEDYQPLNNTCCGDYGGKDFHGQMDYDQSGHQYSMIACLVTVAVPKGFTGRIENYGSDNPYFRLVKNDNSGHRDPEPRPSWQVTYPYHFGMKKSDCSGFGQERFCQGTDGDDNRCTCQLGYKPSYHCRGMLFSSDEPRCHCVTMKCPTDKEAWRSPVANNMACKDVQASALFTCLAQPSPSPPSPSPSGPTASSASSGSTSVSSVAGLPGRSYYSFSSFNIEYLIAVLVALFLLLLFISYKMFKCLGNKFCPCLSHRDYEQPPQSD